MEVYIEKTKEKKKLKFEGKAEDLLKKLEINKEEVIIAKNNQLITLNDKIENKDSVKILSVISGG